MTEFRNLDLSDPQDLSASPSIEWALKELDLAIDSGKGRVALEIAGPGTELSAPVELPDAAEALALWQRDGATVAWGSDERGLVYALTELADRARHAEDHAAPFAGELPLSERPSAPIRSIARLYCNESEDSGWYHDRDGWRDYLSMLVTNRFNRFSLTLGMAYNYPYHNPWIRDVYFYFPYPFLFDLPGHNVSVRNVTEEERDRNFETLKFIAREAARRGLDFQLALWTQRYDFDDTPNAYHQISGLDEKNLAPYCRSALTHLLTDVPEITGLTFRVHVEGGIAEGDYDFWREAFAGVADAGRPVEIDMHGKGLDHETLELARASGMPLAVSPKYMAEHMGLPYHQSAIRDKEQPPEVARSQREQLSEGSRKFLRYSYGDLLTKDKDYSVLYRIWPGTQRVLLWGDPAMASGYGRLSTFAGSDGVEWCEPQSFKGRMGTGVPGGRFCYKQPDLVPRRDWEKYLYTYRVWGRGLYTPDGPRDGWARYLRKHCGVLADACEAGLSAASRVLPLVSLAHGPSASNNFYWPEVYTDLGLIDGSGKRAYAFDMPEPTRFGNAPTFDKELFATPREFALKLLNGEEEHRYSPLDVADWLIDLAERCEAAVTDARRAETLDGREAADPVEAQRMLLDIGISGGLARFFAGKFRAAIWAELFIETGATELIEPMIAQARRAVAAWDAIAELSRDTYQDDLGFGPQSWLRGSWHARQAEMRAELLDLEALRGRAGTESVPTEPQVAAAIATLLAKEPTRAELTSLSAPETFERGKPFTVQLSGAPSGTEPLLHFRPVDQSQHWQTLAMDGAGNGHSATIPAEALDTPFHLQFFASWTAEGAAHLAPGLAPDLSNQPYGLAMQA
ncbi:hypothetical protein [Pelagovum pacificum]|uniref:Beta-hexosaminidase bacterial type N-terminal domain-containing protein n=1 Tax=Pelagovum pacificum TaxID=2588711 RepID=A0A5C5GDG9_9RHOB|nr:hypothetical protein [Pelagovum pacificum]QQA44321.1 hypothetical protein I8N54_07040 [Pelagovum pacificum]TNY32560.1 hypothetical protein FHY64_04535 [Pelagovum pacificum]